MHHVLTAGTRASLRRAAAAALIAAPLAFAGTASAADAPLRHIGIGVDGKRTWQIAWFSSSDDATQVVGTIRPDDDYTEGKEQGVVARDVVAGQTTLLVPAPATLVAASTDVQRLIFMTSTSYSPDDTNDLIDAYVLDRRTGAKTLLSAGADGKAIGDTGFTEDPSGPRTIRGVAISDGGRLAQFDVVTSEGEGSRTRGWRVDLDTGARTELPTVGRALVDDEGRVVVADGEESTGVYVDGEKIADLDNVWNDFTLSPNGRYLGFSRYQPDAVVVIDLETGAQVDVPFPSGVQLHTPKVRRVADDGTSVILSDRTGSQNDRSLRIVYGRLKTDGTLTQLGGGVRHSTWGRNEGDERFWEQGNVTQDGQFAITGLSIAQLGDKPLPGTEPTAPRAEVFTDYVTVRDARCTTNSFINIPYWGKWYTPTITVANTPQRADVYPVVGFKGKVSWLFFGGSPYGNLSFVEPGPTYKLSRLGYIGGWKLSGTLTFEDGSTLSGSKTVPFHGLPGCEYAPFG